MKTFSIIVCVDDENGIAKNGIIPWNIYDEQQNFKKITEYTTSPISKNALIMGRTTFESLHNKCLPRRYNIVLSKHGEKHDKLQSIKQPTFCTSFNNALQLCFEEKLIENIFVIGGEQLYKYAIKHPLFEQLYITNINCIFDCDQHFPYFLKKQIKSEKYSTHLENIDEKMYLCDFEHNTYHLNGEVQYLKLLNKLLTSPKRETRNGETKSLFGEQLKFQLDFGHKFPLLTTKKMFFKAIFEELMFFISGDTDANILKNKNVHIWDKNTSTEFIQSVGLEYDEGDMGPMYGFQWRHYGETYINKDAKYGGYDQLKFIIDELKNNKTSRRIIMTTFNPVDAKFGVLYPCHGIAVQFFVSNENNLSCHMYQRSADAFLGLPFNIASYALLTFIIAKITGYQPYELIISLGDVHIYEQHYGAVETQLKRIPYEFPSLKINKDITLENVNELKLHDIHIIGYEYNHHPSIKAEMVA